MNAMRILIDTNVIMDYIANREPFAADAERIIELCIEKIVLGSISAHTITNLFYILRKELPLNERRDTLRKFCRIFMVVGIDSFKLENALKNDMFDDFEDCLQDECAKEFTANYIITRNIKDFENSSVKAIKPDEFLKNY